MEVSNNKTINNGNKNFSGFFFTLKRSVVIHSCLNRMTVPLSWVCIFKFLAQSQNLKRNFLLVIFSADLPCYVWCVLFFNYGWNNFYSTKIISQKIYKKAIKLFKLHLLLYVKNWVTYHHLFFTYHSQMYFIKAFYCLLRPSIKKYLIKTIYYLFFPIITCRHLLLTYHTKKYFIKAFYYLAKTWIFVT